MKEEQYKLLVSQIASLIDGEKDLIAVMSNVVAAIHQRWAMSWCLAHSKAQSHVCTSHMEKVCVAQLGNGQKPSSYLMWNSSQDILHVAANRSLKSSYQCLVMVVR